MCTHAASTIVRNSFKAFVRTFCVQKINLRNGSSLPFRFRSRYQTGRPRIGNLAFTRVTIRRYSIGSKYMLASRSVSCVHTHSHHVQRRHILATPDPKHRVYRRAAIPTSTNRWIERMLLALLLGMALFPLSFMYYHLDGTVPVTNRKRFLIIPLWLDSVVGTYTLQALGIGAEEDEDDDKDKDKQDSISPSNGGSILHSDDARVAHIEHIFDTILSQNYLKQQSEQAENSHLMFRKFHSFDWRLRVVDKLNMINALCVPGGAMIIYTGILKEVVSSDAECAAIICHEIGHAICRHGIEQMQWRLFLIACVYATLGLFGIDVSWMMEKLFFVGVNVLLQLPMSRRAELEADEVAIYLMQHSGYDVNALVTVMQKLGAVEARLGSVPEFLSTHPLTEHRVEILKKKVENAKTRLID